MPLFKSGLSELLADELLGKKKITQNKICFLDPWTFLPLKNNGATFILNY